MIAAIAVVRAFLPLRGVRDLLCNPLIIKEKITVIKVLFQRHGNNSDVEKDRTFRMAAAVIRCRRFGSLLCLRLRAGGDTSRRKHPGS
jgi:hypothetical protein